MKLKEILSRRIKVSYGSVDTLSNKAWKIFFPEKVVLFFGLKVEIGYIKAKFIGNLNNNSGHFIYRLRDHRACGLSSPLVSGPPEE